MSLYIVGIVLFLLVLILAGLIKSYNTFQKLQNAAETGMAQIQVALKKRLDLITQLTDVVKAYSAFEKSVMENISRLRSLFSRELNAEDIDGIAQKSGGILTSMLAVVEHYPELKASKQYLELMTSIKDVESEILRQRYTYNNIVQQYNTLVEVIPSVFVARLFSYSKVKYLSFEDNVMKTNTNVEMKQ